MTEAKFIEALKEFCASQKFEYRGRIQFANGTLLVYIFGDKCIEPFDNWLSNWTAKHSTPTAFDKEIGSYVTLLREIREEQEFEPQGYLTDSRCNR